MRLQLSRPLNAPVVTLSVDDVDYHFLIDTGCPTSFADHLRVLPAGSLFMDTAVKLAPSPFSLSPLSERLGVPIEGFIGLRELAHLGGFSLDWDAGSLELGIPSHPERPHGADTQLELVSLMGAPIGINGELDGQPLTWFIDTGSRFVTLPHAHALTLHPERPRYRLSVISPYGSLEMKVSPAHTFTTSIRAGALSVKTDASALVSSEVCVAEGMPAGAPPVLGTEWLSLFNICFNFNARALTLTPRTRAQDSRPAWEALRADLYAPPLEISLDPQDYLETDRAFSVVPAYGASLPTGIWPLTQYRLKGLKVPAGVEGVNALYEALIQSDPSADTVTFVDDEWREITVSCDRLFKRSR